MNPAPPVTNIVMDAIFILVAERFIARGNAVCFDSMPGILYYSMHQGDGALPYIETSRWGSWRKS